MEIYHAENLLPLKEKNNLYNTIVSDVFPWYYNSSTASKKYEVYGNEGGMTGSIETFQFTHTFYKNNLVNSDFVYIVEPFFPILESAFNLQIIELNRVKANLMTPIVRNSNDTNPKHHDAFKADCCNQMVSIIYYVNDSDGDTIIYDKSYPELPVNLVEKHRITPKANSMVLFPSSLYHAGSNPTNFERRIVLNFVLEVN